MLPTLTISPLRFLPTVKLSLSRSNSLMTLMVSNCWSLNSNHSIRTTSTSILSQRHITVTTLFDTLLLSFTKCAESHQNLSPVSCFNFDMMLLKALGTFPSENYKATYPIENSTNTLRWLGIFRDSMLFQICSKWTQTDTFPQNIPRN